jgi:hypothetical protein
MATLTTYNGTQYSIPAYNDTGWAQGPGNLSAYLIALATGACNITGNQTIGGNKTFSGTSSFSLPVLFPDGAVGTPGMSFSSDTDTGLYRIGTNSFGLSAGGTLAISGSNTGVSLLGTTTNDSANDGYIGEYVESLVNAANFPASGAFGDAATLTLSAGDWDVGFAGTLRTNNASFTNSTCQIGFSSTSGNSSAGLVEGKNSVTLEPLAAWQFSGFSYFFIGSAQSQVKVSSSTPYYFKFMTSTYSGNTPIFYGYIWARRRR